jgi:probable F420-dependent oxidoreductase
MHLTRFGVWTSYRAIGEKNAEHAAKVAQELGFGALWLGGSPRLSSVRALLEGSSDLVIGTSIVNVWQYDPAELAGEFLALEDDFPGRVLLGLGIGHPEATSEYQKPLAKMRGFLDGLDNTPTPIAHDRLIMAALGPKMLELSGERTLGTIPYFVSPEHTAFARGALAAPAIVAPELAMVFDTDPERARERARSYAKLYLGLTNYTSNLLRFGFTERDLEDGGSDRLIDTVVPQGSAAGLVPHIQAHLDAGADHVCVQTLTDGEGVPEAEWTAMAQALGLA